MFFVGFLLGMVVCALIAWLVVLPRYKAPEPDAAGKFPYQVREPNGKIHDFPRTPLGYQEARRKRREHPGSWLFTAGDAANGPPREFHR